ncbi:transglutaminase-like domain-containing protein [uncultured Sneathiella sp.]|uniref:transglutaminase-like domain-containing protein n=1 Tax=uncultured Sneathiella sp. TaxID=879315 RepID=UPI0030ECF605|tara:strand:- start:4400 stop:5104 length:705 start_codon:yes stop_codon:yes gene_type:complete
MTTEFSEFLTPGPTVDSDSPDIVAFVERVLGGNDGSDKEKAIKLYYAVRDELRYDPYSSTLEVEGLKASRTLREGRGYCVSKAILLAAACRAAGIPARLGYADVRNHMSTEKMRERMQTDIFYWHGYTDIYLDGKWVKSTPAFNIELCDKFGLMPLDFDGEEDSIYHPIDKSGNRHMEYLNYRGAFAEPPLDDMLETFVTHYPHWRNRVNSAEGDFEAEVSAEVSGAGQGKQDM